MPTLNLPHQNRFCIGTKPAFSFWINISTVSEVRCGCQGLGLIARIEASILVFDTIQVLYWPVLGQRQFCSFDRRCKTCLDTKPVLYQGRFCSLTDVLLSDLAKCLSCFETSRGLRVRHLIGCRTEAPCCLSWPWLNVAFDFVEMRRSRRHIALRLLWYLSRNLALSYHKYFMMQTWLRRIPATNYACLAQKHLIHVKLPTIEFGKIRSTTQAFFSWNYLIIAIDQLITSSIVSDKIHAYVPQILCRWVDICCMLCCSLLPISFLLIHWHQDSHWIATKQKLDS